VQVDPLGYAAGINLYAYTDNNPLNGTDPNGTCYPVCTILAGAVIGVGAAYLSDPKNFTWKTALTGAAVGALAGAVPYALAGAGIEAGTTAAVVNVTSNFAAGFGGAATSDFLNDKPFEPRKDVLLGFIGIAGPMVSGETAAAAIGTGLTQAAEGYLGTFLSVGSQFVTTPLSYVVNERSDASNPSSLSSSSSSQATSATPKP
jgi:hypothetical protein